MESTQPSEAVPPSGELARILRARDAGAIMISNMIGTGILTLPGLIAVAIGSTPAVLGAWTLGGVVCLAGALVQAELGSRYPMAGGDYVFLREAYGELPAFLSGWTSLVIGFPGAIALAGMAGAQALIDAAALDVSRPAQVAIAAGILLGISLVHSTGLRVGKVFQNVLTVIKLAILVAIVAAGWALFAPRSGDVAAEAVKVAPFRLPVPVAALLILFTYSGWNAAAYVAGEVRNPRRDLPLALIGGVVIVTILYVLVNVTYLRLVSPEALGSSINLGGEVAKGLFGERGKQVLSAVLFSVYAGTASAMILTGPRIYYAMARDRLLPRALTALGATSHAPVRSLWLQSSWAVAILIAGTAFTPAASGLVDTFDRIAGWTSFAILPFAALTTSSLLVLRRRDARAAGASPWRSPAHPVATVVFVVAAVLVAATAFITTGSEYQVRGLIGFGFVAAGVPVYVVWSLRRHAPGAGRPAHGA